MVGAVLTLLSAWVRYAGTAKSITPGGTYALFFIAQVDAFCIKLPRANPMTDLNGHSTSPFPSPRSKILGNMVQC